MFAQQMGMPESRVRQEFVLPFKLKVKMHWTTSKNIERKRI